MNLLVLGSGMMGRGIAFDSCRFSQFESIGIADNNKDALNLIKDFLQNEKIETIELNVEKTNDVKQIFQNFDIAISAVPYRFNYSLANIAIETNTHFLDLGGNNEIVNKELSLYQKAKNSKVTIIPDCGLAPGLASVIVRDLVNQFESIEFVKIRVGGLPVNPKSPLNYQMVFSPYGLINEYVEEAIVLSNGNIIKKKTMTEIEKITFPKPFENLEAFVTSGGCSTLPFTYKDRVGYLDYKTIRYPGHCEKFKTLIDLGFASKNEIKVGNQKIIPREILAKLLLNNLPINEEDVVLLKVISKGKKDGKNCILEYTMIDYYDKENEITSMMRTTSYPVSILAQMIEQEIIKNRGVFTSEKIVPCEPFFKELKRRKIIIDKKFIYS